MQADLTATLRELESVLQQIGQRTHQTIAVSVQSQKCVHRRNGQGAALGLRAKPGRVAGLINEGGQGKNAMRHGRSFF